MGAFNGNVARIDTYCYKNRIPHKLATTIQSVVEEMCMQILIPEMEEPDIDVSIEYSASDEKVEFTFRYPGKFDPEESKDSLAYTIATAHAVSRKYSYFEQDDMSEVRIVCA